MRLGGVFSCTTPVFEILRKRGLVKEYQPSAPAKSAGTPVNTEIQPEAADIAGIEETSAAEAADQDTISEPGDEQPAGVEETSAVRKPRRKRNSEPQE